MRVLVIGAGVIGCAIARELALRGVEVTILESDEPGAGASWAAAGMLSPQAEADRADPFLELLLASRRMYPDFVRSLHEETGIDVHYRSEGTLLVAIDEEDEAGIRRRGAWQNAAGLPVEWLSGEEARRLEPALSGEVRAALRFADDHQVDNRLLAPALRAAAEGAGAGVRCRARVTGVVCRGAEVRGVALEGGEVVEGERVVVAAGVGAAGLGGMPRPLPVRPVHGQLLALRAEGSGISHVVDSPRVYLVPRRDGRVIVGATMEEIGLEKRVTAAGLRMLLAGALEAVPALGEAAVVETWSGHRPGTPDGWPILGADPEVQGLVYATGHYRNGILLTPVTARVIADLLEGVVPAIDLSTFAPARFTLQ